MTNDENYSQEAIDYANARVSYEMNYACGMGFTDKQKEWIKEHLYFSVRKAYQKGLEKEKNDDRETAEACELDSK